MKRDHFARRLIDEATRVPIATYKWDASRHLIFISDDTGYHYKSPVAISDPFEEERREAEASTTRWVPRKR